jgi:ribosomal protein S18 acetylase RimI-like enzyme
LIEIWHHHVKIDSTGLGVRAPKDEQKYPSGMLRLYRANRGFTLVAELDGVLAGFAAAWVTRFSALERMIQRPNRRGHISELCVLPQFRERGVGAELTRASEARLLRRGCDLVGLEVSADNAGAERLYRELGYRSRGLYLLKRVREPPASWAPAARTKQGPRI